MKRKCHSERVFGSFSQRIAWIRYLGIGFLLALCPLVSVAADGDNYLTILVMPLEHPRPGVEELNYENYRLKYPHVLIDEDNKKEWGELRIGWHNWLFGQLEEFIGRQKAVGTKIDRIKVRFLAWHRALTDIETKAYNEECDVIQVPSTWAAHLIEEEVLAEWNDPDLSSYPRELLETCRINREGPYYAVPWHRDFRVLYYREELTSDPNELTTYARFRECLQRRKDNKGVDPEGVWQAPMGIGNSMDEWDILHGPLNWAFSGIILEKNWYRQWQAAFHRGVAKNGLKQFYELSKAGLIHFTGRTRDENQLEWEVFAAGLVKGEFDCTIGGPWMRVKFQDSPEIRAACLPRMTGGDHTFLGGSHLGVTKVAEKRRYHNLAVALVKHLTSKEAGIGLYKHTDAMPAHEEAFKEFLEETENSRWAETFRDAMKSAKPYPVLAKWAKKIEMNEIRSSFYGILDSIARQHDWEGVETQLGLAAEKVNDALKPSIPWWVWVVLAVVICYPFVYLIRSTRYSFWRLNQQAKNLIAHIDKIKEEITKKTSDGQIEEDFSNLQKSVDKLVNDLKAFRSAYNTKSEDLDERTISLSCTITNIDSRISDLKQISADSANEIKSMHDKFILMVKTWIDLEEKIRSPLFDWPPDVPKKWSSLSMVMCPMDLFFWVTAGGHRKRVVFADLEFVDKRTSELKPRDKAIVLAKIFLGQSVDTIKQDLNISQNVLHKRVQEVNEDLQSYFDINEKPMKFKKDDVKYETQFNCLGVRAEVNIEVPGNTSWDDIEISVQREEKKDILIVKAPYQYTQPNIFTQDRVYKLWLLAFEELTTNDGELTSVANDLIKLLKASKSGKPSIPTKELSKSNGTKLNDFLKGLFNNFDGDALILESEVWFVQFALGE